MRSLTYNGITWYDGADDDAEGIRTLQKQYGFHDLDVEDSLSEHERPKIEEYESYLFLVFHIPTMNEKTGRVRKEEVNLFIGQGFVVTIHEGKLSVLEGMWQSMQDNPKEREEYLQYGTGFFLYELLNQLFDQGFPIVEEMSREIRALEDELFEKEESVAILKDIMNLKRNVITMRSILLPQRAMVATLEHKNRRFVPEELALYFDDILDAIERQWALLDTAKEVIDALQDTHESWLTQRTNAVLRVLTLYSVLVLPISVISGLYGMNVNLPLQQHPLAFALLLFASIILTFLMLVYFARKRLL